MTLSETPSQTVGPYFSMQMGRKGENELVAPGTPGRIRIQGRVFDGDGSPIEDAYIEVWQANEHGRYRHPDDTRTEVALTDGFTGFGRCSGDFETGVFWFDTLKPGRVPDPEGMLQAPHISVIVQARGMLNPSFTRLYFGDEVEANSTDMVLAQVPPTRRQTLIAELVLGSDPPTYKLDIRFGGSAETVFFEI